MANFDAYLEPPEPTNDENVCTSCEYRDCICDLAHDLDQENHDYAI